MKHVIALLLIPAAVFAAPRTSGSYTITAETTDSAGRRATSANYTAAASSGGVTGISIAPGSAAKHGYIGQLYDVKALTIAAAVTVDETATLQLAAMLALDDDTLVSLALSLATWSVDSGPITGISAIGLATAAVVFADTPAVVRGTHGGFSGTHALTVVNIFNDNYRLYAIDGIADDWQVLHFGEQNPDAAPLLDPDGDGQTNLFEYIAGLTPTDPGSRLQLRIEPVLAEPSQRALFFHPVFAGRTYIVHFRDSLTLGDWQPLTGALENTTGQTRTVTDLDATVPARFYRVEVSKD